ncbi:hypothetical protein [Halorussus halobius]|uniref:hypothetical protein n=1 Tax=Halorussus halobius TaxID=1710537 RepID=UPI001092B26B|nr:hypothetical protein [Halorussus halobius]
MTRESAVENRESTPTEVLEKRAIDITESLADERYDDLEYFPDRSQPNIVDAWERITGIHGEFDGIVATDTDPDVTTDGDRRAIVVHFDLDGSKFKTQTEFHPDGSVAGFWILRGRDTTVLDLVSDTGLVAKQEALSKVSSVFSLLSITDDDDEPEPVGDEKRQVVEEILTEFEDERFDRIHDRLTPDLKDEITASELGTIWNDTVTDYRGIDAIARRDEVIEVAVRDADGTKGVLVSLTDDGTVDALRIDTAE